MRLVIYKTVPNREGANAMPGYYSSSCPAIIHRHARLARASPKKRCVFFEMPGQVGHDEGAERHGRRDRPSGVGDETPDRVGGDGIGSGVTGCPVKPGMTVNNSRA